MSYHFAIEVVNPSVRTEKVLRPGHKCQHTVLPGGGRERAARPAWREESRGPAGGLPLERLSVGADLSEEQPADKHSTQGHCVRGGTLQRPSAASPEGRRSVPWRFRRGDARSSQTRWRCLCFSLQPGNLTLTPEFHDLFTTARFPTVPVSKSSNNSRSSRTSKSSNNLNVFQTILVFQKIHIFQTIHVFRTIHVFQEPPSLPLINVFQKEIQVFQSVSSRKKSSSSRKIYVFHQIQVFRRNLGLPDNLCLPTK
ncbi:uncharacterized protein LOC128577082 [Nycticebus coucang]|uniref:uncharacterized protein LOC128577082 n=1 Tax=Nycticebus coucang TaxID=9470 RepID=UPI00234D6991|nr:uncharacterized protein LOC128577082 [Nycticebus coucang]